MPKLSYFLSHPVQYQVPMVRHLIASGVDLEVVYRSLRPATGDFDSGFNTEVVWDVPLLSGYTYHTLPDSGGFTSHLRHCQSILGSSRSRAAWIHGWGSSFARAAWLASRQQSLPVLIRGDSQLAAFKGSLARRWLHRQILRRLFRTVDHFLAVGTANRDFYLRYGVSPGSITTMPYAVDNEFFQKRSQQATPHRPAFRRSLGLDDARPVILFVGKLHADKAPDVLLEAMRIVAGSTHLNAPPALIMVGDGEMRGETESLARTLPPGIASILGFRNQTELPALYDLCDVFVLPSNFEPWGLVVNEAMNAGKPVIVSDRVGSGADLVFPGENGFVFPAGDKQALASCLLSLFTQPELSSSFGKRSLEIIRRWSFDQDLTALQAALRKINLTSESE